MTTNGQFFSVGLKIGDVIDFDLSQVYFETNARQLKEVTRDLLFFQKWELDNLYKHLLNWFPEREKPLGSGRLDRVDRQGLEGPWAGAKLDGLPICCDPENVGF